MRKFEELDFLKLMLAKDPARIFSRGARLGAEAGSPGRDVDGEFFLRKGFVAIKIVQLDFGCRRKPEVGVLNFEEIRGKFRQLPRAHQRRGVDKKWRKNFRVAVLTGVHVEEKICKRAFEPRSPASVNCKSRAGDFRGGLEIQDSRALADLP